MKKIIEYEIETGQIVAVHIVPPDSGLDSREGIGQLEVAPEVSHFGVRVHNGELVEA